MKKLYYLGAWLNFMIKSFAYLAVWDNRIVFQSTEDRLGLYII